MKISKTKKTLAVIVSILLIFSMIPAMALTVSAANFSSNIITANLEANGTYTLNPGNTATINTTSTITLKKGQTIVNNGSIIGNGSIIDAGGEITGSGSIADTVKVVPVAPTNLAVDESILSWEASISNDVAGYNVYANDFLVNADGLITDTSCDLTAIDAGTYDVAVETVNSYGNASLTMASLEAVEIGTVILPVTVDKTILGDALADAAALNADDFTADSWANLDSAVTDGQSVYDNEEATQVQVNEAAAAITDAIDALVAVEVPPVEAVAPDLPVIDKDASVYTDDAVTIQWTQPGDVEADKYEIYAADPENTDNVWFLADITDPSAVEEDGVYTWNSADTYNSLFDLGMADGSAYDFIVYAINVADNGTRVYNESYWNAETDDAFINITLGEIVPPVIEADKTELQGLVDDIQNEYDTTDVYSIYTNWNEALSDLFADAQAVLANEDATQPDVDAAYYALKDAYDNDLILIGGETTTVDKDALSTAIDAANATLTGVVASEDGTDVAVGTMWATQDDMDTLIAAIADAQAVFDNADATQIDVDAAVLTLNAAAAAFVPADGTYEEQPASVDKTELQALHDQIYNAVVIDKTMDPEAYTNWDQLGSDDPDSMGAYWIADAILADDSATQAQVDTALADLQVALATLELKPVTPVEPTAPALNATYDDVANVITITMDPATVDGADTYTLNYSQSDADGNVIVSGSVPFTGSPMDLSEGIVPGMTYTYSVTASDSTGVQADVTTNDTSVTIPQGTIVPDTIDTTELQAAIALAAETDTSNCTTDSVTVLENAVIAGNTVLDDPTTQEQVDAAALAIYNAINALEQIPAVYAISLDNTADPMTITVTNTGNVATGDLTVKVIGASALSRTTCTVDPTTIPSLAAGDSATITVTPNDGLAAGDYSARIGVYNANIQNNYADAIFTVEAAPLDYSALQALHDQIYNAVNDNMNGIQTEVNGMIMDPTLYSNWDQLGSNDPDNMGAYWVADAMLTAENATTQDDVDTALANLEAAVAALEPVPVPVDTSALVDAITAAQTEIAAAPTSTADDGSDVALGDPWYANADIATYQVAIDAAQAVADADGPTQADVDAAIATLADATTVFEASVQEGTMAPDKTALQALHDDIYNAVNDNVNGTPTEVNGMVMDPSAYSNWDQLGSNDDPENLGAYWAAEAVLADDSATQSEVDTALANLEAAVAALIPIPVDFTVDTSISGGVVSLDWSANPPAMAASYTISDDAGINTDWSTTATNQDCQFYNPGETYIFTVTALAADGTTVVGIGTVTVTMPVDLTALETAITSANALTVTPISPDGTDVPEGTMCATQENMDALTDAITAAQAFDDTTQAQADIDAATATLQAAIDAFNASLITGTFVDKTALQTLIDDINTNYVPNVADYTIDSWAILNDAYWVAATPITGVLYDDSVTQAQVDAATDALRTALDSLIMIFPVTATTTVTAVGGTVTLDWSANPPAKAVYYTVSDDAGINTDADVGSVTSQLCQFYTPGATYTFTVKAYDADDNQVGEGTTTDVMVVDVVVTDATDFGNALTDPNATYILMGDDMSIDSITAISSEKVIDLGGNTLTLDANINNSADLTIVNGTVATTSGKKFQATSGLAFENVTFILGNTGDEPIYIAPAAAGSDVTFIDCTFTVPTGFVSIAITVNANVNLTVHGCDFGNNGTILVGINCSALTSYTPGSISGNNFNCHDMAVQFKDVTFASYNAELEANNIISVGTGCGYWGAGTYLYY
ncbi:MAG: hypothetical protein FWD71_11995 [Oscillospiraceae bacterium]|nr:hypothetical protein [Oscillospiraceae bacterium]